MLQFGANQTKYYTLRKIGAIKKCQRSTYDPSRSTKYFISNFLCTSENTVAVIRKQEKTVGDFRWLLAIKHPG